MTIDTHGRAHRPAGSPASTGGQFAAQAAPGQSQSLGLSPEQNRELVRAVALDAAQRLVATERIEAARKQLQSRWPNAAYLHWGTTEYEPDRIRMAELVEEDGETVASGAEVFEAADLQHLDPEHLADRSFEIQTQHGWMPNSFDLRTEPEHRTDVTAIAALLDEQQIDEMTEALEARRLALRHGHLSEDELLEQLSGGRKGPTHTAMLEMTIEASAIHRWTLRGARITGGGATWSASLHVEGAVRGERFVAHEPILQRAIDEYESEFGAGAAAALAQPID
ncbi:hypothetical protein AA0Z99_00220 [Agrococcus sp. 1P02AA]|uniref:hypothetical protein n=1 Tax=Agrococcus sp. 1P02AA TaxID=3132259 RepID=UPI0039A4DBDE